MKNQIFFLLTLVTALVFTSCKRDEVKFSIEGTVTNVTGLAVRGATVTLKGADGSTNLTTSTDASGHYVISDAPEQTYTCEIARDGYLTGTTSVSLTQNVTNNATLLGTATISGLIIDSQTGEGLANATVSYTFSTGAQAELRAVTNTEGVFTIAQAPVGSFTGVVEAVGFFPRAIEDLTVTSGINELEPATCVAKPAAGDIRIILTWGYSPDDLDSHLTGPDSAGGRFHIYFEDQEYNAGEANLDVDDITSYGPETVTIKNFNAGVYRYSVHNYTDQSQTGGAGIYQSPAIVEVYDANGLVQSFQAPAFTGIGNTWRVFEMTNTAGTVNITPVNTYIDAYDYWDSGYFKTEGKHLTKAAAANF